MTNEERRARIKRNQNKNTDKLNLLVPEAIATNRVTSAANIALHTKEPFSLPSSSVQHAV